MWKISTNQEYISIEKNDGCIEYCKKEINNTYERCSSIDRDAEMIGFIRRINRNCIINVYSSQLLYNSINENENTVT